MRLQLSDNRFIVFSKVGGHEDFSNISAEPCSMDQSLYSGGSVPGFDEFVFGPLSNDGSSAPAECVTGCETMLIEGGLLILLPGGAFMFLRTCSELPTGLVRVWHLGHHVPMLL